MQKFRAYPLILWLFLLPLLAQPALGADATSFDPTRVEVKAKGSGGVPVGTIISWPVSQNPEDMDNWLECNGQSISRSVYPELYALLGANVPDLRGLFLRGHGGNSSALGVRQSDMVGLHDHIVSIRNGDGFGSGTPAFDETDSPWGWVNFRTTAGNNMGSETRPMNMAVRYFIRARP